MFLQRRQPSRHECALTLRQMTTVEVPREHLPMQIRPSGAEPTEGGGASVASWAMYFVYIVNEVSALPLLPLRHMIEEIHREPSEFLPFGRLVPRNTLWQSAGKTTLR